MSKTSSTASTTISAAESVSAARARISVRVMAAAQLAIAVVILTTHAGAAEAASPRYSKQVQKACTPDYKQFCSEYGIETAALRLCMNRVGHRLSNACVNALVAAGEVSQSEVNLRKRAER